MFHRAGGERIARGGLHRAGGERIARAQPIAPAASLIAPVKGLHS